MQQPRKTHLPIVVQSVQVQYLYYLFTASALMTHHTLVATQYFLMVEIITLVYIVLRCHTYNNLQTNVLSVNHIIQ